MVLPALALVLIDSAIGAQTAPRSAGLGGWRIAGRDLDNSRNQPSEHQIGAANVSGLVPRWVFTTGGDVSATPTVAGNSVYFPDWDGSLYSVRADTGELQWRRSIADYNGQPGSVSRVSPAIFDDMLITGDNISSSVAHDGAHVMAIDRTTGALRWITKVDAHPAAVITGSPVFNGTTVYVGVSSNEELLAANPAYPCCTFRGSMVALDVATGAVLWKTFTVPDNGGATNAYSGNAIWAPPAIDPDRGSLYIGTGNNYTVPDAVLQCQQAAIDSGTPNANCAAADDLFDTVLALDLATGAILWQVPDPTPNATDPGAVSVANGVLYAGSYSGAMHALDARTGAVLFTFASGGSVIDAPSIVTGTVFWGSGYRRIAPGIGNNKLYAFSAPGQRP
jgi:polyvinyl alcohol dehydrogenase (cytochrome)